MSTAAIQSTQANIPPLASSITWNPTRHYGDRYGTSSRKWGTKWMDCWGHAGPVNYEIEPKASGRKFAGYCVTFDDLRTGNPFTNCRAPRKVLASGFIDIDSAKAFAEQHLRSLATEVR